ncbi:hypothetical protein [Thalassobacillus sp. CUG 92003]|uniref:hypothetical protein n=1 Tax=Thalassobacillus sp. CUG 92003 TaxID=2736641 RepID=UPI0015E71BFD|nr:hypothetical protein [Thalassobacillus sp. CUG 92003]
MIRATGVVQLIVRAAKMEHNGNSTHTLESLLADFTSSLNNYSILHVSEPLQGDRFTGVAVTGKFDVTIPFKEKGLTKEDYISFVSPTLNALQPPHITVAWVEVYHVSDKRVHYETFNKPYVSELHSM